MRSFTVILALVSAVFAVAIPVEVDGKSRPQFLQFTFTNVFSLIARTPTIHVSVDADSNVVYPDIDTRVTYPDDYQE